MTLHTEKYYSCSSGLILPLANKALYPPEFQSKSRLNFYSSLYNTIEINSSFYKLPMARTVRKWADEVPPDFRFTFKMWREITHLKDLKFKTEELRQFMEIINQVGGKKACVLLQFPPKIDQRSFSKLEDLLKEIRDLNSAKEWQIFVELRNNSWYNEELHEMLNLYDSDIVRHDKIGAPDFVEPESNAVYLRFHGPGGNYRGSYTEDFLQEYAGYVIDWILEGKTVYIYFNNTMGEAIANLNFINGLIHSGLQNESPVLR